MNIEKDVFIFIVSDISDIKLQIYNFWNFRV